MHRSNRVVPWCLELCTLSVLSWIETSCDWQDVLVSVEAVFPSDRFSSFAAKSQCALDMTATAKHRCISCSL